MLNVIKLYRISSQAMAETSEWTNLDILCVLGNKKILSEKISLQQGSVAYHIRNRKEMFSSAN